MAGVLILYSTVDGQTLRICERMRSVIEASGRAVTLISIDADEQPEPAAFDSIVIGASIRYGKHRKSVFDFVAAHRRTLDRLPTAFFSVNIVARKPERNRPETNPYVRHFLAQTGWKPRLLGVFAGRLDYPKYRPLDRQLIRLIMWMTGGPTDPSSVIEYTDWCAVESFAREVCAMQR